MCAALALACAGGHGGAGSSAATASADGGAAPPADASPPSDAPPPNPIELENAASGAVGWRLQRPAGRGEIEGYALAGSAAAGETVPIAVSTSAAGAFSWTLYRLGHYGGAGAREVARGGPLPAAPQPACTPARGTGLVACGWTASFTLALDPAWVTGLYALKLTRADGYDAWVPLVVREASPRAPVVVVVPTATWQAYNAYGGESLYLERAGGTGAGRAFAVSYDRPYATDYGAGHLLRWDHRLAQFLEAQGEDVAYVADEDVDRDPARLRAAQAVVLSSHDEYWTNAVRDAMDAAVAGGTSLLLFGANSGYWRIRYGPAGDGRERRVVVCYKRDAPRADPVGPASPDLTVQFRQPPAARPESALFGVMFSAWDGFGFPMVPRDPGHWAFAGTGLAAGDALPLVGGYEVDDLPAEGAGPGVEVLADATMLKVYGGTAHGRMVVRQEGAALVFAAGGIDFTSALAGADRADPRVQRIAANVLGRALDRAPRVRVVFGAAPAAAEATAREVRTAAGVAFVPGDDDGPPGVGRLRAPGAIAPLPGGALAIADMDAGRLRRLGADGALTTIAAPPLTAPSGLAADASGALYVADTGAACIRRIAPDGGASVLAGACGAVAQADGPGASARFVAPSGLALAGGTLYVADTGAGTVRAVDLAAPAHAVSTVPGPTLSYPTAVAAAPDGTLYVVESGNTRVVALKDGALRPVAGAGPGFQEGGAASARLLPQLGIALLPGGALVVSDAGNDRVRLVKDGQVSTLAGTGQHGHADGPGSTAELALPAGLAVDGRGHVLVAEAGSSTVREIVPP